MEEIFTRRSIRRFEDRPIDKTILDKLLRAAMQAPSAGNERPWEFLVVESKETLGKLSRMGPYSGPCASAPMVIVFLGNTSKLNFSGHWQQELGAATENLLLEAVHLGLGAVWMAASPEQDWEKYIIDLFGLPEQVKPFCLDALGYPAEGQSNRFVDRYEANRVHFETYGNS